MGDPNEFKDTDRVFTDHLYAPIKSKDQSNGNYLKATGVGKVENDFIDRLAGLKLHSPRARSAINVVMPFIAAPGKKDKGQLQGDMDLRIREDISAIENFSNCESNGSSKSSAQVPETNEGLQERLDSIQKQIEKAWNKKPDSLLESDANAPETNKPIRGQNPKVPKDVAEMSKKDLVNVML
ncbi:hypothetical protein BGZ65_002729 [Modicella reniformis]|uniref:Uncharacterized protein n=1 Tax=Modicella reniformis TaxID=1440133 RepID=A0A9P6MBG1_9FUNG|nr:hypothetical protein BGZ65_002729 [Modicella reniformis]